MKYIELRGRDALTYLEPIAKLRIKVFAEWPYIYEGDLDYEKHYLETYFKTKNSFITLAFSEQGLIVGATTAVWLPNADPSFQKPFLDAKYDLETICYYGESVLLSKWRGQGVGKEFMFRREKFAKTFPTVIHCAFCAVMRPNSHPLYDKSYKSLDGFWHKIGFSPVQGMVAHYSWKDIGDQNETEKPLQFWMKKL